MQNDKISSWLYADNNIHQNFLSTKPSLKKVTIYELILLALKLCSSIPYIFHKFIVLRSFNIKKINIDILHLTEKEDHSSNHKILSEHLEGNEYISVSIFNKNDLFLTSSFQNKIFFNAMRMSFKAFLALSREENQNFRRIILRNLHRSFADAIYFYYLFLDLSQTYPKLHIFSTSGLLRPLVIASNLGIKVSILTHGIQGKPYPLGFPAAHRIYLHTQDEEEYFKEKLRIPIVETYDFKKINDRKKNIIFFLRKKIFFDKIDKAKLNEEIGLNKRIVTMDADSILEAINFFQKNNFEIYIKMHPYSAFNTSDLQKYVGRNLNFLDQSYSAEEGINLVKPMFTVGWFSSSLAISLLSNVMPVCIDKKPYNQLFIDRPLFKFYKRTINFHEQRDIIKKAMESESFYDQILNTLCE